MQYLNMTSFNSINRGKVVLVLCLVLTFFQISYSQIPNKKQTLDYLNQKMQGSCILEISKGNIIANYYSSDGNLIREDRVFSGALDTVIKYDASEQLLSVPCLKIEGDCVTRKLFVQKIKRTYARISFVVKDETQAEEIKKALQHLIRIESEPKYKDEISFD